MQSLLIILAFVVVLSEVPQLLKAKKAKELLVLGFFTLMAGYLSMVQLFDWPTYQFMTKLALVLK